MPGFARAHEGRLPPYPNVLWRTRSHRLSSSAGATRLWRESGRVAKALMRCLVERSVTKAPVDSSSGECVEATGDDSLTTPARLRHLRMVTSAAYLPRPRRFMRYFLKMFVGFLLGVMIYELISVALGGSFDLASESFRIVSIAAIGAGLLTVFDRRRRSRSDHGEKAADHRQ